jgi:hypothetical protein
MEICSSNTCSKEDTYKNYRENNHDRLRYLRLLETDWPCSIDIILNFCEYLTDILKVSDHPVLDRAINYGLSQYRKNLGKDDPVRFSAFIQGVLDSIGKDMENTAIYDNEYNDMWTPLTNYCLRDWLNHKERTHKSECLSVTKYKISAESISKSIFKKVLDYDQQLIVLEELNWLMDVDNV